MAENKPEILIIEDDKKQSYLIEIIEDKLDDKKHSVLSLTSVQDVDIIEDKPKVIEDKPKNKSAI